MAQRIEPKTQALAERERRAIADLKQLFPDGIVSRVDQIDKQLGKRLSALYASLGYESRKGMIEAFGFEVVDGKGGRPSYDPELFFSEVEKRYEGKEKPKTTVQLIEENPDLYSNYKTVANKAKRLYGHAIGIELAKRGLVGSYKERVSDAAIADAIEALTAKYASVDDKPKSIEQLKSQNAEYADEIEALKQRCTSLYGATVAVYLKNTGILKAGPNAAQPDEIEAALAELELVSKSLDEDNKPKTLTDLCIKYPEYAELIKAGQKQKLLSKKSLTERGILALSQAARKKAAKRMKARLLRNAELSELVELYKKYDGFALIRPDDQAECLRPGIVGLDIDAGYELRETTLASDKAKGLQPDEPLSVTFETWHGYRSGVPTIIVQSATRSYTNVPIEGNEPFLQKELRSTDSPLNEFVGVRILERHEVEETTITTFRYRFLAPLSVPTMLYALRSVGAVEQADFEGGDAWRAKLEGETAGALRERLEVETTGSTGDSTLRAKTQNLQSASYSSVAAYDDCEDEELTFSQFKYLRTIADLVARGDRVWAIDIASELGYSKPSVSGALKNLELLGYITREGRAVALTQKAKDALGLDGSSAGGNDMVTVADGEESVVSVEATEGRVSVGIATLNEIGNIPIGRSSKSAVLAQSARKEATPKPEKPATAQKSQAALEPSETHEESHNEKELRRMRAARQAREERERKEQQEREEKRIREADEAWLAKEKRETRKAERCEVIETLSGNDKRIYDFVRKMGGAVDTTTVMFHAGVNLGSLEIAYSSLCSKKYLVSQRCAHPFMAESSCWRFYTVDQVDENSNPKFDIDAYIEMLEEDLEFATGEKKKAALQEELSKVQEELAACKLFDLTRKKELKKQIASIQAKIAQAGTGSFRYHDYSDTVEEVKKRLKRAKKAQQKKSGGQQAIEELDKQLAVDAERALRDSGLKRVKLAWFEDNVRGMTTAEIAVRVLKIACDSKKVVCELDEDGKPWFKLAIIAHGSPENIYADDYQLASDFVRAMRDCGEERVTARWVTENVQGVSTIQRATQVLRIAITNGDVIRELDEKGKPWFVLTDPVSRIVDSEMGTADSTPSAPSRSTVILSKLAVDLVLVLRESGEEYVSAKWVAENVPDVRTTQMATQVLRVAIANGDVIRELDERGKPWYKLA